jgi:hypothetical protein
MTTTLMEDNIDNKDNIDSNFSHNWYQPKFYYSEKWIMYWL